ncbi:hypothetical protein SAMN05660874_01784 [Saccharopolyspora flava]|uniref:Uncharacterized protein n=2 Tax=Saccharopolyspora flava TaxID=95161 RepID=A0A1I6QSI3_9PSEU|nr:hypothetical protein SAMN05660874_01784 [Saccharopolyspora flava]
MSTLQAPYGSGVTLNSNGSVTLAPGVYTVDYTLQGDPSGTGTVQSELVSAYLNWNGAELQGSRVKSTTATTAGLEGQVSNTVTINATAGGTVSLMNGAVAMTHNSTLAGIVASMNIHQVLAY